MNTVSRLETKSQSPVQNYFRTEIEKIETTFTVPQWGHSGVSAVK